MDTDSMRMLVRDLGWVGFELSALSIWTGGMDDTSGEWLLLSMET